jgi:cysteine synthase
VRHPDARLAAALITFARAAGAALVQSDGTTIELTAGGFGLALRSSAAWRHVHAQ